MPRTRKIKLAPVRPTVTWERNTYTQLRKAAVVPFLDAVNVVFNRALLNLPDEVLTPGVILAIEADLVGVGLDEDNLRRTVDRALVSLGLQHTKAVNRVFSRAIKVDIRPLLQSQPAKELLERKVTENVNLIKTMSEKHKQALTSKLRKQYMNNPFDRYDLSEFLRKGDKSAGYNLRRIVRDQNNKAIGQLNQMRQTSLGVQVYEWSTSGDRRVRPSHQANDGETFRWDTPPPTGPPGEDVLCRCVSYPILESQDVERIRDSAQAMA